MIRATSGRELFTLEGRGVALQGTYHQPIDEGSGLYVGVNKRARPGILFLSGLSTPRAAHGDSAFYWAESFAALGYPSFRIDLPGSGDSAGGVLAKPLPFINAGGHGPIAVEMVKQLIDRYKLTGSIIMGHCAGAISAVFAAANCKECHGLILLAPYFHLEQAVRLKARRALIDWATRSPLGGPLSKLYLQSKHFRSLRSRNKLPRNANFSLLRRWQELASAGLPILVLNAPGPNASGTKPDSGEFDYPKHIARLAAGRSRMEVKVIEGAHHTFANRLGRAGVRQQVEDWLTTFFPLENVDELAMTATRDLVADNAKEVPSRESTPA